MYLSLCPELHATTELLDDTSLVITVSVQVNVNEVKIV